VMLMSAAEVIQCSGELYILLGLEAYAAASRGSSTERWLRCRGH